MELSKRMGAIMFLLKKKPGYGFSVISKGKTVLGQKIQFTI